MSVAYFWLKKAGELQCRRAHRVLRRQRHRRTAGEGLRARGPSPGPSFGDFLAEVRQDLPLSAPRGQWFSSTHFASVMLTGVPGLACPRHAE
jgi:hypothetical protein